MSIKGIFPIEKWDFKSESILADLPSADFELLNAHQTMQVYKKGEIIFREGAYPAGIFYILSGKVKKYMLDSDGKEHIIYVANTEELLGSCHSFRRSVSRFCSSIGGKQHRIYPQRRFLSSTRSISRFK